MLDAPAPAAPAERCIFCGESEELSLHEAWVDGNFTLATCCAGLLEHVSAEMHADPAWGRTLLRRLGAEDLTGRTLRRVTDGAGNGPVLDFKLEVGAVSFAVARAFVERYHRHCAAPRGWRFGFAVFNGYARVGVVTVGNPVARALNGRGIVEVNRLCVRDDLDPMLKWNACSMLYARSAREAERRGFNRIVTYTREDEGGATLRAAGWNCDGPAAGRGWHGSRRSRSNVNAWIGKLRWSLTLRPKTQRPARTCAPPGPVLDWLRPRAASPWP